jgi:hypothetical protein
VSEQQKRVFTEQLTFDVPPRVRRTVRLTFKQAYQHGFVEISLRDPAEVDHPILHKLRFPYKVAVDLAMDVTQQDRGRT